MDIKPLAQLKRTMQGRDYFLLWAGVALSLAEIWAGGFLAPLGLTAGIAVIVLGHLIGNTFMTLAGDVGSRYGIMSMVSLRPAFGIRGSKLGSALNVIQLVGWASVMLIIAGRAGSVLGKSIGFPLSDNRFWILLVGGGTLGWALLTGKSLWKGLQAVSVTVLLLIAAVMTWVSFGSLSGELSAPSGNISFMGGLDLVIAMPISWMPLVADYARFSRSGTRPAFHGTWWGYFIVSSWMYLLGMVATMVSGSASPEMLILSTMGSLGLAIPALIMVIFSTITSDYPDIYSGTCSFLNITTRFSSKVVMLTIGIISLIVAMFFPAEEYELFLLFIGAMFIPLFGVSLTDYFLVRRKRIEVEELYRQGGCYWYRGGFNLVAFISWVLGFAVFEACTLLELPIGASLPSLVVGGGLYWLLTLIRCRFVACREKS